MFTQFITGLCSIVHPCSHTPSPPLSPFPLTLHLCRFGTERHSSAPKCSRATRALCCACSTTSRWSSQGLLMPQSGEGTGIPVLCTHESVSTNCQLHNCTYVRACACIVVALPRSWICLRRALACCTCYLVTMVTMCTYFALCTLFLSKCVWTESDWIKRNNHFSTIRATEEANSPLEKAVNG